MLARSQTGPKPDENKSLESGILDAACSTRRAQDALNCKDKRGKLRTFDRGVANPMWNQDWCTEAASDADELDRFPSGAGFPGKSSADWGWVQHMKYQPTQ